ncbi:MAG: hypothetical protein Q8R53_05900 [Nanoarchaeota archaeon]|nr:hypothetical protein [Nanoarchaeota archaeon]
MSLIPDIKLSYKRQQKILEELLNGPSPDPAPVLGGTSYNDITFEQKASYNNKDKQLLTYDQSLARLQAAGHKRHPRPAEAFSLLIASLEEKLSLEQKAVADDMLASCGEWLSAAAQRKGDTLTVYFDPQGLVWDGSRYIERNFLFSEKRDFSLAAGILSNQFVDLSRFSPELVTALYSRLFQQLPQPFREGNRRAQVYLPPDNQIRPVGRGYFNFRFGLLQRQGFSRGSPVAKRTSSFCAKGTLHFCVVGAKKMNIV